MSGGLRDPMLLADAAVALRHAVEGMGYRLLISNDFDKLAAVRMQYRGSKIAPFFDPTVNAGLEKRGFWMAAEDANGDIVGLQAFRLDIAEPSLADWALGWHMGLYLKRGELAIPREISPPKNSISERVSGRVVYHGEVWIGSTARGKGLLDVLPRLGIFLTMIKWQPDAMWGLIGCSMATRGQVVRLGYSHMERGFLQWEFLPMGAEDVEWLVIAQRDELELLLHETDLRIRSGRLTENVKIAN